ncbi:MAG: GNAT family N-acetyltransferase [Tepidiformaceae bacterium]
MDLYVEEAELEDKSVLRRMLQLYLHDMSEFTSDDLDAHGEYGYKYLDDYWTEDGRYPFIFRIENKLAGFALVRRLTEEYQMAEFCILRKYRRTGLGKLAAETVIRRFGGRWAIYQLAANTPAQKFWDKVADEVSGGEYEEYSSSEEVHQTFTVH